MAIRYRVLLAGLFFTCCKGLDSLSTESLSGSYIYDGIYDTGARIVLKPDSTFIFDWAFGLNNGSVKGKWEYEEGYILLNSEKQPNRRFTQTYEILDEDSTGDGKVVLKVVDQHDEPIFLTYCIFEVGNDTIMVQTDTAGICKADIKRKISRITVCPISYETAKFIPLEGANFFKVRVRNIATPYIFFTNEKWLVKDNKLIEPVKGGQGRFIYLREENNDSRN